MTEALAAADADAPATVPVALAPRLPEAPVGLALGRLTALPHKSFGHAAEQAARGELPASPAGAPCTRPRCSRAPASSPRGRSSRYRPSTLPRGPSRRPSLGTATGTSPRKAPSPSSGPRSPPRTQREACVPLLPETKMGEWERCMSWSGSGSRPSRSSQCRRPKWTTRRRWAWPAGPGDRRAPLRTGASPCRGPGTRRGPRPNRSALFRQFRARALSIFNVGGRGGPCLVPCATRGGAGRPAGPVGPPGPLHVHRLGAGRPATGATLFRVPSSQDDNLSTELSLIMSNRCRGWSPRGTGAASAGSRGRR